MSDLIAVNCGDLVKDLVTGFEGVVIMRTSWLHGCDRITVLPMGLNKDGQPKDDQTFDEQRVEIIERNKVPARVVDPASVQVGIGSECKDTMTGFKGIAAGLCVHITGLVTYVIEPEKLDKDLQPVRACVFESTRVELIKPKPIPVSVNADNKKRGGPAPRGENLLKR